jgi:hypothetical protein
VGNLSRRCEKILSAGVLLKIIPCRYRACRILTCGEEHKVCVSTNTSRLPNKTHGPAGSFLLGIGY